MTAEAWNVSPLIYHYTSKDAVLEHILPSMTLRMGEYARTNDPRESKQWWPIGASKAGRGGFWKGARAGWDEIERVQRGTRILCLTLDHQVDRHLAPVEFRGYGLSRMWAQYANGHSGICLGFDSTALRQAIRSTVPNPDELLEGVVRYVDLST